MRRRTSARTHRSRKRSRRRFRLPKLWPSARSRGRWWRTLRRAPLAVQTTIVLTATLVLWFLVNGIYQVILKPTELFFPVSGTLYKTPAQTWDSYERIFRKHATRTITAEFLAALAQVEGSGNPIVRTYWRWSLSPHPLKLYRPASSAVGMYQITDGTFAEARRYCIHDHLVVEEGPWKDFDSCWFNELYVRVIPSHAVELTAAYLDNRMTRALARHRIANATPKQRQHLAAIVHLCGAAAGDRYAKRRLQLRRGQRCGDHDVRGYLAKVDAMQRVFAGLSAREK